MYNFAAKSYVCFFHQRLIWVQSQNRSHCDLFKEFPHSIDFFWHAKNPIALSYTKDWRLIPCARRASHEVISKICNQRKMPFLRRCANIWISLKMVKCKSRTWVTCAIVKSLTNWLNSIWWNSRCYYNGFVCKHLVVCFSNLFLHLFTVEIRPKFSVIWKINKNLYLKRNYSIQR